MDINTLTIGQAKELLALFKSAEGNLVNNPTKATGLDSFCIGKTVIIRTYSAGVWCGTLVQKAGNEVILQNARRMWRWWCKKSISLSGVARYGIIREKSKIAPPVEVVWLEAIEIISIAEAPAISIMEAPIAQAE